MREAGLDLSGSRNWTSGGGFVDTATNIRVKRRSKAGKFLEQMSDCHLLKLYNLVTSLTALARLTHLCG